MRLIKELAPKPSDAIIAMLEGIEASKPNKEFILDFSTFGRSGQTLCYGCAATCAVQQLSGIRFEVGHQIDNLTQRSELTKIKPIGLRGFELAIDDFRLGKVGLLSQFYAIQLPKPDPGWILDDEGCMGPELARVQQYLDKLLELGL